MWLTINNYKLINDWFLKSILFKISFLFGLTEPDSSDILKFSIDLNNSWSKGLILSKAQHKYQLLLLEFILEFFDICQLTS